MKLTRSILALSLAAALAACATGGGNQPKPTPTPTPVPQVAIFTIEVVGPEVAWVKVGDREWVTKPDRTILEEARAGDVLLVSARADGFITSTPVPVTMTAGRMPTIKITLAPVPFTGRRGPVRLNGRVLVDDDGPFAAYGATLFWALWGEKFDQPRLERDLTTVARGGGDYVRFLSMVGGVSWEDRTIDPRWADYWTNVDNLEARAARLGVRLQVTIFAAAQDQMPSRAAREAWVDRWAAQLNKNPSRYILAEIANEYWQNGLESAEELRDLTARLNRQTSVLVAPSAAGCGSMPEGDEDAWRRERDRGDFDNNEFTRRIDCRNEWRTIYSTGAADVATPHFDRDISKADGANRPIRQPWEMQFAPSTVGVMAFFNNEPIGPQSSVAEDGDPQRLAMAAASTWVAGGAAYTLHSGGGIRGGGAADLARGRSPSISDVPNIVEILSRIAAARKAVPPALANCKPQNANAGFPGRVFDVDPATVTRAYQAVCSDGTFVAVPHGIRIKAELIPRFAIEVNGQITPAGVPFVVPEPSAVIVGRIR